LAAAVAARLAQTWGTRAPRVVVIEPEAADCLFQSARHGRLTEVDIQEESLMAGLSCGEPSVLAWQILQATARDFVRLPDTLVAPSMWRLANPLGDDEPVVAGESAVPGVACLMAAAQQPELKQVLGLDEHSTVLVFGTEGATDAEIYRQLLTQGAI
ncbi:MAG: pyridoxal-phosphate dependent enzyme, partial [Granulosicoccaceae bacterium]